ncbi:ATP-dependent zinc metalloprotease FtsH [Candidatus Phytoplasma pruni]|uniref:ATP-dependent zinc metalloprotease FtsH n=2 Tax=Candidatus Phytoplasma pruni TaxID=479893 RepID=A0A851HGV4_9MOLU|nr:ATP-dependent zinc metalloprotease FtsH [Candidatus Phytoplasma pruni]
MNEAAILSVRNNKLEITNGEINQAIDKIVSGPAERSPFRLAPSQKQTITFKDVAGNEEEKEEMKEIIDFLKNPQKYKEIGASIPKGVLLEGPPGTGKTLLAKAVAGEANKPFFVASGSEFVEKYVGVGASRIRELFKEARQNAPCVLFIDEIDVLGSSRGNGEGGSQEKDQTLNQLLTEMDGFEEKSTVIVIGATNRKDMLDSALLRPGRFDRQFTVGLPDVTARKAILKVHAKNKKLAPSVNLEQIAKQTPSMSGAQLASIMNEASILTVRNDKKLITTIELEEAIDRVLMGPAKKSRKYNEEEKKMVAYHEAGHAVIGLKLKHAPKVQKVTIIPRGDAGGYNLMLPEKETFFSSKKRMLANITSYLGGRAAEELMFDDISNGAYGDFKSATQIATQMVTKLGMSDLGPIQTKDNMFFENEKVNQEIKKIIDECMIEAKKIMKENKTLLDKIAHLLIKQETITKEEIEKLL